MPGSFLYKTSVNLKNLCGQNIKFPTLLVIKTRKSKDKHKIDIIRGAILEKELTLENASEMIDRTMGGDLQMNACNEISNIIN